MSRRWLARLGFRRLAGLLTSDEARTFLRVVPILGRVVGDAGPAGGVGRVLGALLRTPVGVGPAVTRRVFATGEESRLADVALAELGRTWVLGGATDEAVTGLELRLAELSAQEAGRLAAEGWLAPDAGGLLAPTDKLVAVSDVMCPVWADYTWVVTRAGRRPGAWRLKGARLGTETILVRGRDEGVVR